jgi:mRNA interferase HicA
MKYAEVHKRIRKAGWKYVKAEGSHYLYEKDGRVYPVPFHGSKEMSEGVRFKIFKDMDI